MMALERRRFGRTGWQLSCLGVGTYHLTSDRGVSHREALAILRRAMALGVNVVDTAPLYGGGEAEQIVGEALRDFTGRYKLINKVGRFETGGFRRVAEQAYRDPAMIRAQFEHCLRLLARDTVDLLLIHESDWPQWWDDIAMGAGPVMEALTDIRREGLTECIGLSVRDPAATGSLCKTGLYDAMLYVHYYNMIWQENGDITLPVAQQHDMGIAIGAPYRQGLLIGEDEERLRALERERRSDVPPGIIKRIRLAHALARDTGYSLAELGLRFLLNNPLVHVVMVGPKTVEELEQNVMWADKGPLPPDIMQSVLALRKVDPGSWD